MFGKFDYEPGDIVTYSAFGGELRTGVVVERFDDVKNGYPGFNMALDESGEPTVWGYDNQIISVQRRVTGSR
jgi:hypothetical protein